MYTQFFGNYLLNKGIITATQLFESMQHQKTIHTKLGLLAIHAGFLTAKEVEQICIMQTHIDKLFGELAVAQGLLTNSQVQHLLFLQQPDFLTLSQSLIDKGYITTERFEEALTNYQSDFELAELEFSTEHQENLKNMIEHFYTFLQDNSTLFSDYLTLLFNTLIRFIGEDFTPYPAQKIETYPANYCITQIIHGDQMELFTAIDMDESTFVEFAKRYTGENFKTHDDYVSASVEDFINLHNGLFTVNMSNNNSSELELNPTQLVKNALIDVSSPIFYIPIKYTFGAFNILISITK